MTRDQELWASWTLGVVIGFMASGLIAICMGVV